MEKHTVNLLIKHESESPLVLKLKVYLPIAAVVGLTLFVVFFLISIIYINNNNQEFNALKLQIETLEKRISTYKNSEGMYTLTVSRINTITQLSQGRKNFASLISEIPKLQFNGLEINQTSLDKKNNLTLAVTASSSGTLDEFISLLLKTEAGKRFSDIKSAGVVRDKTGSYLLTISMKPNNSLLQ